MEQYRTSVEAEVVKAGSFVKGKGKNMNTGEATPPSDTQKDKRSTGKAKGKKEKSQEKEGGGKKRIEKPTMSSTVRSDWERYRKHTL